MLINNTKIKCVAGVGIGVVELVDEDKAVEADLVEPVVYTSDAVRVEHGGQDVEAFRAGVGSRLSPLG